MTDRLTLTGKMDPRSLLLGAALGALVAVVATLLLTFTMRRPARAPQAAYTIEQDGIRLRPGQSPLHFDSVVVREGPPLRRVPVTARVAAVETRTSPSYAPLEGRIERVSVRLGDSVAKGARLALVRSGDLATMLRELRASQAAAQTKQSLVQRMNILVESRAASANELLLAKNDLKEAELSSKAADSRLKSLSVSEEGDNLYWMLSTQAGTVVQLDAAPGLHVGPSKDKPVATIADLEEVLVLADVSQHDVVDLAVGTSAQIRLPGSTSDSLSGKIETVSQVVDPERQTVPIRILLRNPDHLLRPNAFVEATFAPSQSRRVLLVPTESVVSDGLDAVVFVEQPDGLLARRKVMAGRQSEGSTEILAGLRSGERVVHRGAILLLNTLVLQG